MDIVNTSKIVTTTAISGALIYVSEIKLLDKDLAIKSCLLIFLR